MRRLTPQKALLYSVEYPRIEYTLAKLAALAPGFDSNIAAVILFGSVARLEPHEGSDCDILLLLHDPVLFFDRSRPALLLEAGKRIPQKNISEWGIAPMVGSADGRDLDEDFLACVAEDAVLLFLQNDYRLPPMLENLIPFSQWQDDVHALMRRCRPIISQMQRQRADGRPA